jgi:protein SCO1
MKTTRRAWLATLALAPVAGALAGWATRRRTWAIRSPRELIRGHHFPDVELTTHEQKPVRFYSDLIQGKKVVIQFMYAHCKGVCLPVTDNLVRVQELLAPRVGRDLFFYSITLEPKVDTPEDLRRYADAHGVGPGWLFLTGRPEDCETLRRNLGFTDPDPALDADVSNHSGNLLFGNEPLMLWAACPGQADAEWIAKSIRAQVDRPT